MIHYDTVTVLPGGICLFMATAFCVTLINTPRRTVVPPISAPQPVVLRPGLVLLRNAIGMDEQLSIASQIFKDGHCNRKWWAKSSDKWVLNNERQGRGRIYDSLSTFCDFEILAELCGGLSSIACAHDETMPHVSPTHMLVMYYTTARKLGWHRDDGSQDGQSIAPVVSVSIGNSCDFLLKQNEEDPPILVKLESGDVILFGGESRHILHTVQTVHTNSCPDPLRELHEQMCGHAPNEDFSSNPPSSFRLNLTFRHAPELIGKENSERFIFFAKSARSFLSTAERVGTEEARRMVLEKRAVKAAQQKEKKQRKSERRKALGALNA